VMAQDGQSVGQYAARPVVEGQRYLRLIRVGDYPGRGGEAPALVNGDLQVPLKVTRAYIVNAAPLRRSDRVIRKNPPAPDGSRVGRHAVAGRQAPTLDAQPSADGTLVRDAARPVVAQRKAKRFDRHGTAYPFPERAGPALRH